MCYYSAVSSSQPPYHQQASVGSQPPYHQQPPSSSQVGSGGSGQAQHLSSSQSYSSRLTSQVEKYSDFCHVQKTVYFLLKPRFYNIINYWCTKSITY